MKNIIFVMFLAIAITFSNCTGDNTSKQEKSKSSSSTETKQTKQAEWLSFDKGLAKAKADKKNIIVDFYTDWCHWCKVMDEKTFRDPGVNQKLVERFITVRLNAEDGAQTASYKGQTFTNIELTQAFGVRGFPSLAFMDMDGEIITLVPGYVPAETFLYLLDYIDQECYKKQMPFEEFMKKKGECEDRTEKK